MFWRREPPPPPEPVYRKRPIATIAVILSFIGMFVLGPIGAIYKGLTEELKSKANNETLLLYMKQQKEDSDRQWKEIERNRQQQIQLSPPRAVKVQTPVSEPSKVEYIAPPAEKTKVLTPEQFEKILSMKPEIRIKYKKYLESKGFDVSGLPDN